MLIHLRQSKKLKHRAMMSNEPLFIYFDQRKIAELTAEQTLSVELPLIDGRLEVGYPRKEPGRILSYPPDYALHINDCAWKSDVFIIAKHYEGQEFIVGSKTWLWFDLFDLHHYVDAVLFIRQA